MTVERDLALRFLEDHPQEAALALDRLPAPDAAAVLGDAPAADAAAAVRAMLPAHACRCLALLGADAAAGIAARLTSTEAASLLRRMADEPARDLVAALPERQREAVARTLRYPVGTAGAFMDPSVFELPAAISVADARDRLRAASRELLYYVYVVDDGHHLVGVLDIPDLMLARARDPLRSVMTTDVQSVLAWEPASVVLAHPGWREFHAMPVVDEERRLVGAIRYQTLRRLEREAGGADRPPATMTALALGELYHLGLAGFVEGFTAPARGGRQGDGGDAAGGTGG